MNGNYVALNVIRELAEEAENEALVMNDYKESAESHAFRRVADWCNTVEQTLIKIEKAAESKGGLC